MRIWKYPHEWAGVQPYFWAAVAKELPQPKRRPFLKKRRKGGRPRNDDRSAFGAILWRLRSGGGWDSVPERFGSADTARRRLATWQKGGRLERAWRAFLYQQSRMELERWNDVLSTDTGRRAGRWRFELDLIWRYEFAPLFPSEKPISHGLPRNAR